MLLNKTEKIILQEFCKDYSKRIYGWRIARDYKLNQKTVSNILNRLEKKNILKYEEEGKNKYYFLNKNLSAIKEIIKIAEIEKRIDFLNGHLAMNKLFRELQKRTDNVLIVFGSYAKSMEDKLSDLDLIVIGKIKDTKDLEESFNIDINVIKSKAKIIKSDEPFIKELMENHIILKGIDEFVDLKWS